MQRKEGLVVRIQIKDESGRVVGETEAVTMKGLLSLAHEDGLQSVRTRIVELPTEANGRTAVVHSVVRTRRGTFTGIGDANPQNVNRRIVPHLLRMAETRATARALRLAVNIGEVAIEELGEDVSVTGRPDATDTPSGARAAPPERSRTEAPNGPSAGRDTRPTEAEPHDRRTLSEEQKKLLFRLALELGETKATATAFLLGTLGVERFDDASRAQASQAIDTLKRKVQAKKSNGHGQAPSTGGGQVRHDAE
jgi:hypothetical protein